MKDLLDQHDEKELATESFHEALIGALNGAALTAGLFTGAAVLVRKPELLWNCLPLLVFEVIALIILGFVAAALTLDTLNKRLRKLPLRGWRKWLLQAVMVTAFAPLIFALTAAALAQVPNLKPKPNAQCDHPASGGPAARIEGHGAE